MNLRVFYLTRRGLSDGYLCFCQIRYKLCDFTLRLGKL